MATLNLKKNEVQVEALKAWVNAEKRGTCEIITGLGKTFIGLHALYTMPKNKDVHLFLAETVGREKDLMDDIKKYNEIFNRNVLKDYNLEFHCYQTVYKWRHKRFGLIIADEIHDSLSPAYSQFYFHNEFKAIIGLSATVNKKTSYKRADDTVYTKGDLLKSVAPICYTYSVEQGIEDKTARKLAIYVILHKLEENKKTVPAGNSKKRFMQTEAAAYTYWDKRHKQSWYIEDTEKRDLQIRITSTKRSNILYNLESKVPVVKKILAAVDNKTIVFGNSLDALLKVTPNVVSSRNSEDRNKKLREDFDKGKVQVIGSFKKLKQGANLKGLDNCILMSYYSTDKDFIQRIGRLRQNGEIGNVFILLTQNTQEEVWFRKMTENISKLDITYCPNVDFCIRKINEQN
jgi:superfamily II DNA or RNA helicase